MKLIDLETKTEWSRNYKGEVPPATCIEVADDHPFFIPFNSDTHHYVWDETGGSIVAYTEAELAAQAEAKHLADSNAANLLYLAQTDWYVVRFTETGSAIPADVSAARQAAREAII